MGWGGAKGMDGWANKWTKECQNSGTGDGYRDRGRGVAASGEALFARAPFRGAQQGGRKEEKKMNTMEETAEAGKTSKPGKVWLWGLAVLPLLAVGVASWAGMGGTAVKAVGFAALLLCGSMDVKAVKKAGHAVPKWWWGLSVFLSPAYLVCRVLKTDQEASERIKRFAPVGVWAVLFAVLLLAGGGESELNAIVRERVSEQLQEMGGLFQLDDVLESELLEIRDGYYEGTARIRVSTRMGARVSGEVTYLMKGMRVDDGILLEFCPGDEVKELVDEWSARSEAE